jgi:ADP-heptose:LPS heptosyltransferase
VSAKRASLPLRQQVRLKGLQVMGRAIRTGPTPGAFQSILLLRPDHLGDVLLLTPALHALRQATPHARITLAVGPWSAGAVLKNDDVDEVLTIPFPGFERRPKNSPLTPYRRLRDQAHALRARGFDTAVVLRFDHWWGAWLAAFAGIPRRIGYDWPEVRPFLTHTVEYRSGRHETLQNAGLLSTLAPGIEERLGPTRIVVTAEDHEWARVWLADRGVSLKERVVAIHPGAGAAVKQWPVDKWVSVARALEQQRNVRILVTGGAAERGLAEEIMRDSPPDAINAAGETTLGGLAALYARSALVLGVDSGPLHLAVATGTPSVHLYGPVSAAKFGPWGDARRHAVLQSRWACVPCDRLDWPATVLRDHGCIATVGEEAMITMALSMLGGS